MIQQALSAGVSRRSRPRRIALVLGGGGLKGFAHIGVLRVLQARGIRPAITCGTSIGALIAAAYASGMSLDAMEARARAMQRADLFRLNHVGMLLDRMRSRSIYLEEPLRAVIEGVVPDVRFDEIDHDLLVNTVDLQRGTQVVWGLPGLRDVSLRDAVYASCALPGYFPPGVVNGATCVDGGTTDNLPVAIAGLGADVIIGVDVGSSDLPRGADLSRDGFAALFMRAATVMMHELQTRPLTAWAGPPLLLIRPRVAHLGWFNFQHTAEVIAEGERAAEAVLDELDAVAESAGGIWPRRTVNVEVDRDRCTGCGTCAALEPAVMGMDAAGKAFARMRIMEWSPADGEFVHHCPTQAIRALRENGAAHQTPGGTPRRGVPSVSARPEEP